MCDFVILRMTSLLNNLPRPTLVVHDRDAEKQRTAAVSQTALVSRHKVIPPYRHRQGYIPRTAEDFGDGGAFPEIHIAQYPLDMGRKKSEKSNALAVPVDDSGKQFLVTWLANIRMVSYAVHLNHGKS